MANLSKAGTGAGTLLVISSTAATVSAPAPAPSTPPTALTLAPTTTPTGIAILQMKEFSLPSQKLSFDNITNTSSPSTVAGTVTNEFLPTVLDGGEFGVTGIFLPSDPGLVALQTAFYSGLANQFQIQLPKIAGQTTSGNVYEFNAWVQELPVPVSVAADKALNVKLSLKLQGVMTVATGS
jgi:hypothetical protein